MPLPPVRAIVFDLGEVLIKLDFSRVNELRRLTKRAIDASIQAMNEWTLYDSFERGHLDEREFITRLNQELSLSLSAEDFRSIWNSVLKEPVPGIELILTSLAQHYPLWALTNSNETHINHFKANYPWQRYFQAVLTSFELGHRKPELEIYKKMIQTVGFNPDEILFLDDREENIEGARRMGIRAELCKHTGVELPAIFQKHSVRFGL